MCRSVLVGQDVFCVNAQTGAGCKTVTSVVQSESKTDIAFAEHSTGDLGRGEEMWAGGICEQCGIKNNTQIRTCTCCEANAAKLESLICPPRPTHASRYFWLQSCFRVCAQIGTGIKPICVVAFRPKLQCATEGRKHMVPGVQHIKVHADQTACRSCFKGDVSLVSLLYPFCVPSGAIMSPSCVPCLPLVSVLPPLCLLWSPSGTASPTLGLCSIWGSSRYPNISEGSAVRKSQVAILLYLQ